MRQDDKRAAVCARVSRFLREERLRQGMSMTVLAQKAGLSQAMISFVERDLRNPTLETLLRIAEVLEVDLGSAIQRAVADSGDIAK